MTAAVDAQPNTKRLIFENLVAVALPLKQISSAKTMAVVEKLDHLSYENNRTRDSGEGDEKWRSEMKWSSGSVHARDRDEGR